MVLSRLSSLWLTLRMVLWSLSLCFFFLQRKYLVCTSHLQEWINKASAWKALWLFPCSCLVKLSEHRFLYRGTLHVYPCLGKNHSVRFSTSWGISVGTLLVCLVEQIYLLGSKNCNLQHVWNCYTFTAFFTAFTNADFWIVLKSEVLGKGEL